MLSSKELFAMSQIEIDEVDQETLVDIDTVVINQELSHEEKVLSYIKQMGNPYCFQSGNTSVRVRFAGNDVPLSDALVQYFSRLKQK